MSSRFKIASHICFVVLLSIILILSGSTAIHASSPYYSMTQDHRGRLVYTLDGYTPSRTLSRAGLYEFTQAEDIFVDQHDNIYIADTGNSRILKVSRDGILKKVFGQGILKAPHGIFVDKHGYLYVADPNLMKIVVFSSNGYVVQEYTIPNDPLFGLNTSFIPLKLVVDAAGSLYVLSEGNTNGMAHISKEGDFLGYFGANYVALSIEDIFRRIVFTEAQRMLFAISLIRSGEINLIRSDF